MKHILTAPKEERCIGCGLCVIKACLLKGKKIDLSNSFIRISRVSGPTPKYKITIDYGNNTAYKEIVSICPRGCFKIEESKDETK